MATNFYINRGGTTSEKNLYEDIIIESIRFYGHDIIYLPRTLVNRDDVLGEDNISKFTNGYSLEMYFETNEGFAGEQELINKFGIELRDDTSFCVAKRTWERFVGYQNNTIVAGRPNEGDIIYFPLQKTFFEILFVEDQEPFFQLNNLPVYKLKVTKWEYNSELVSTGNSEIDDKSSAASLDMLNFQFTLENEVGSILLEGDETNYLINESYAIETQSPYADNTTYEVASGQTTNQIADDILDFTERNPFGEVD